MKTLFKNCCCCGFLAALAALFAPLARGDPGNSNPYLAYATPSPAAETIFAKFDLGKQVGKIVTFLGGKVYDPRTSYVQRMTYVIPAGCPSEKLLQVLHVHVKTPPGIMTHHFLDLVADGISAVANFNLEFICFDDGDIDTRQPIPT